MNRSEHELYGIWGGIRTRCLNPKHRDYRYYGARGIKMCERWKNSFDAFLVDMGPRPTKQHSVGRRNNDGDYEPENCRWETRSEQHRNYSQNRIIEFQGARLCMLDWSIKLGIPLGTLRERFRLGWDTLEAFTTPRYGVYHKQAQTPTK